MDRVVALELTSMDLHNPISRSGLNEMGLEDLMNKWPLILWAPPYAPKIKRGAVHIHRAEVEDSQSVHLMTGDVVKSVQLHNDMAGLESAIDMNS